MNKRNELRSLGLFSRLPTDPAGNPDHLPVDGAYFTTGHESVSQTNGSRFGKGGEAVFAGRLEFLGINSAQRLECFIQSSP